MYTVRTQFQVTASEKKQLTETRIHEAAEMHLMSAKEILSSSPQKSLMVDMKDQSTQKSMEKREKGSLLLVTR